MTFNHPLLLWGLLLVALPVLIHLINLLRQRRVRWAAMEFLLAAQKKNRRWIRLKQLLLLLARMAAVAAVVLIVAQAVLPSGWTAALGSGATHHVIVLDDSFSMSDRRGDSAAFDRAKGAVLDLARRLVAEKTPQQVTLITYSGAAQSGQAPRMMQQNVQSDFATRLEEMLLPLECSSTGAGPGPALEAVENLPVPAADESRIVYLVSDFRAKDWTDSGPLAEQLKRISEAGAQLDLVHCVDQQRPNLALAALEPDTGTRAAGVELPMTVAVTNYGDSPRTNVSVQLAENGVPRPSLLFDEIAPGRTATRQFRVRFPNAGTHRVTATLEDDAVTADNARFAVIEMPLESKVLIVDDDPTAVDSTLLSTALNPRGTARTGISPQIERSSYLREHALEGFAVVYLVNLDRLEQAAIARLEAYVQSGGGLGIFVGEKTDANYVNEMLYRDGQGLFPAPLLRSVDLPVERLAASADIEGTDHPIFRFFAKEQRNSFLSSVLVERYFALPPDWALSSDSATEVIARLRNGAPLVLEKTLGRGHVVAFLTKASPATTPIGRWNNWGQNNPTFVVVMLQTQAYLASAGRTGSDRQVASPIDVQMATNAWLPQVTFKTPQPAGSPLETVSIEATVSPTDNSLMTAALGSRATEETALPGFYEALLTGKDGAPTTRVFALNVDPAEGNLARLDSQELAARLVDVPYRDYSTEVLSAQTRDQAGSNISTLLLAVMVGLLIGEQWLAWSASYHASRTGGAR